MSENLLNMLKHNKDRYLSGQELSRSLSVSRTAIWKKVKNLQDMGYIIDAVKNKGYKLIKEPDILYFDEICSGLKTKFIGRNYLHFDSISSTNTYAKENILSLKDGTVIIAEEQTNGRGRLGRSWTVKKGDGILMSIVLKPQIKPTHALLLTHITALSIAQTLESIGINTGIKWPNDIIVNEKKVCGILLEMIAELDIVGAVIIGIGLNVNCDEFPMELSDKATSLREATGRFIDRKNLVTSILNNFEKNYLDFLGGNFKIDIIKNYSVTIGKNVRIIDNNKSTKNMTEDYIDCYAVDIDENGYLVVKYNDGTIHTVLSGDVSVRGIAGYVQ